MGAALVLDAMGVIYEISSLGKGLLLPFIDAHGGDADGARVKKAYREASLGHLDADDFWRRLGLDPAVEDACLSAHRLNGGFLRFMDLAAPLFDGLYVLSNDVSRWSVKLRNRYGLEGLFDGWLVSGDLAVRKPDPAIYQALIEEARLPPERLLFVDDKLRNLEGAAVFGMGTVLFGASSADVAAEGHLQSQDFTDLLALCQAFVADGRG